EEVVREEKNEEGEWKKGEGGDEAENERGRGSRRCGIRPGLFQCYRHVSASSRRKARCARGEGSCRDEMRDTSRVVIWSSLINPAMDCVLDERIIGESDRSSPNCYPKSEMGTGSDDVAGFTKCVAECNFDRRDVRVHRSGLVARGDVA